MLDKYVSKPQEEYDLFGEAYLGGGAETDVQSKIGIHKAFDN
jgi:hypothetical protein